MIVVSAALALRNEGQLCAHHRHASDAPVASLDLRDCCVACEDIRRCCHDLAAVPGTGNRISGWLPDPEISFWRSPESDLYFEVTNYIEVTELSVADEGQCGDGIIYVN